MALISRMMTCSSFFVTVFLIGPLLGVPSYSVGGGVISSWKNIYLYHEKSVESFFGEVANRERRHPSKGGIRAPTRVGKGGIWDKRRPGTRAKGCPGFPGPADFRA